MKQILVILTIFAGLFELSAEAIMTKAYATRVDLLRYLRVVEPIVRNYPGKDKEGKEAPLEAPEGQEGDRVSKYNSIKRLFQEGVTYYYEGRYPNSYRRFLEAQVNLEQLLEEVSQTYLENTDIILKSSLDKKDPKNPVDKDIVDISVEFGKGSHNQIRQDEDREAPFVGRGYDPKEYHYRLNKDQIEGSVAVGYKLLGQAKNAKLDALKIERHLEKHQKVLPMHRKYRIERYLEVIARCREARMSAMNIFKLKYPYDNEYLQTDDKVELESVSNVNRINPFAIPKKLSPVFDNRIPVAFRRDAVDTQGLVFYEEVNQKIRLERTDVDSINRLLEKYGDKQKLEKPPEKAKATGGTPSKDASGKGTNDKQPTPPPAK